MWRAGAGISRTDEAPDPGPAAPVPAPPVPAPPVPAPSPPPPVPPPPDRADVAGAATPDPDDAAAEPRPPGKRRRNDPAERGLRDLVGAGPSQLGPVRAMRARDANRPTDEDLAQAEQDLVIVRRHWKPPS